MLFKSQKVKTDEKLEKTFADYVMFQNSGAEATNQHKGCSDILPIGKPNKTRILCVKNSFHGRTLATIFASDSKNDRGIWTCGYWILFGSYLKNYQYSCDYGWNYKRKVVSKLSQIFVKIYICDKKNIILIQDEVECELEDLEIFLLKNQVKPDIVPIAKGIGGGFPIGAVLMSKKVAAGMKPGTHGSTFGGNPLAMAVGNKVMDIVSNKKFLNNIKKLSKYFIYNLNLLKEKYPKVIKEIRGRGLLIGIQLYTDQAKFIKKLMDNKLLTIRAAKMLFVFYHL